MSEFEKMMNESFGSDEGTETYTFTDEIADLMLNMEQSMIMVGYPEDMAFKFAEKLCLSIVLQK